MSSIALHVTHPPSPHAGMDKKAIEYIPGSSMQLTAILCKYLGAKANGSQDYTTRLYCALCNNTWVAEPDEKGRVQYWSLTIRQAGDLAFALTSWKFDTMGYHEWYNNGYWCEGAVSEDIQGDFEMVGLRLSKAYVYNGKAMKDQLYWF